MAILCDFGDVHHAAQAVAQTATRTEGRHFSPRPWNRFEPKDTTWWLVPSTDWPAYRYGKGMLQPTRYFPGKIMCSLYIEKGFGATVGTLYPQLIGEGAILDGRWTWFHFLRGCVDGSVLEAAKRVDAESESELIVWIGAGYPSEPAEFNPYELLEEGSPEHECRSPVDGGQVWFRLDGERLKKLEARCVRDVMEPVVGCDRLEQLPEAFDATPDLPWCWVDVQLGVPIELVPDGPIHALWHAADVWRKLLQPWLPWIV